MMSYLSGAGSYICTAGVRSVTQLASDVMVSSGKWDDFNRVAEGLYIGRLPRKEALTSLGAQFNHQDEKIIELVKKLDKDRPLKLVVSAVLADELEGLGFPVKSMVSKQDWLDKKIDHHLIPIEDFTAKVENKDIILAIEKIRKAIESGSSVLVHCKAGRSRSAMLCAIYLAVYGKDPKVINGMSLNETVDLLVAARKQVQLHGVQRQKAAEVIAEMRAHLQSISLEDLKSESIRGAVQAADEIAELTTFPKKKPYGFFASVSQPATNFCKLLKEKDNQKWFFELMNSEGLLSTFINENKAETAERKTVVEKLRRKTMAVISNETKYTPEKLVEMEQIYRAIPSGLVKPAAIAKPG